MPNLDEQVEAIRAAFRARTDNAFEDDEKQDWLEGFNSEVERVVKYRNLDASKPSHLSEFFENVLRSELSVMMDDYHSAMHFSHFLNTHSEAILQAIVNRLKNRRVNGRAAPIYVQKDKVRHYLKRLNHIFQAKLARGEEISAIPYMTKPKQKPSQATPTEPRKGRGKSKKKSVHKQGRKQALMGFESIKEAAKQTGQNYNTLKSTKRRHELNSI